VNDEPPGRVDYLTRPRRPSPWERFPEPNDVDYCYKRGLVLWDKRLRRVVVTPPRPCGCLTCATTCGPRRVAGLLGLLAARLNDADMVFCAELGADDATIDRLTARGRRHGAGFMVARQRSRSWVVSDQALSGRVPPSLLPNSKSAVLDVVANEVLLPGYLKRKPNFGGTWTIRRRREDTESRYESIARTEPHHAERVIAEVDREFRRLYGTAPDGSDLYREMVEVALSDRADHAA
jgi:hypothetical protein